MKSVAPPAPVSVVFCALRDKDWREMLRALAPVADHFVLTMAPTAPASRAWDLDEAHAFAHAEGLSAEVAPSFESALERARLAGTTILITGSFHTVGDAMARLQASPESR
jgi:dihydrofolate synthase/folylpolyglutamate synthase